MAEKSQRALRLAALCLSAAVVLGTLRAILSVVSHGYLGQGMLGLVGVTWRSSVNAYLMSMGVAAIAIAAVWILGGWAARRLLGGVLSLRFSDAGLRSALGRASGVWACLGTLLGVLVYESSSLREIASSWLAEGSVLDRLLPLSALRGSPPLQLLFAATLFGGLALLGFCATAYGYYRKGGEAAAAASRRPRLVVVGLSAAALLVANLLPGLRSPSPDAQNIVLLTVDTLRADHLASYGYERITSPNVDRLAARSVLFRNAVSQAPWTLPAMASIHTGLYPWEHNATHWTRRLSRATLTLGELLQNEGYQTLGVVTNEFVSRRYGFAQGFERFDQSNLMGHGGTSSEQITTRALEFLAERDDRPFFLWVHYFDPHYSYLDREESDFSDAYRGLLPAQLELDDLHALTERIGGEDLQYILDVYDEEIVATDLHIGRILDYLGEQSLDATTAVVVTADHGEEFNERARFGHGEHLYRTLIDVPLVVHDPSRPRSHGSAVEETVETRAVFETILGMAGITSPAGDGVDLMELRGRALPAVYSHGTRAFRDVEKIAVVSGSRKLIRDLRTADGELYDLVADPSERSDLIGEGDARLEGLLARVVSTMDLEAKRGDTPIDEQLKERLRALGYVQ